MLSRTDIIGRMSYLILAGLVLLFIEDEPDITKMLLVLYLTRLIEFLNKIIITVFRDPVDYNLDQAYGDALGRTVVVLDAFISIMMIYHTITNQGNPLIIPVVTMYYVTQVL